VPRHGDVLRKAVRDGKTIETHLGEEVIHKPRPWAKPGDRRPWLEAGRPDESRYRHLSGEVRVRV